MTPAIWTLSAPAVDVTDEHIVLTVDLMRKTASAILKELGGKYSNDLGAWAFPKYIHNATAIQETFGSWGLKESDAFTRWQNDTTEPAQIDMDDDTQRVYAQLYPFQQEAVNALVADRWNHHGNLLALSPGLGKTVVALTAAKSIRPNRALVVAPLSLLEVWRGEMERWFGQDFVKGVDVVHGTNPDGLARWVVTNYETVTLGKNAESFRDLKWDVIILDESVMVKNRQTKRFEAMKALRTRASRIWLLSGSPITRHPSDLWAQFHLIDPKAFRSFWRFTNRYCVVDETVWGKQIVGSSERDIQSDFRDLLFVRHQEQVLPDLPDMIFQNITVELTKQQRTLYNEMEKEFIAVLSETEEIDAPTKLTQLLRLQQITSSVANISDEPTHDSSAKHDALMTLLDAEDIEFPLLIWTHWSPGARALSRRLDKSGYRSSLIQGDMNDTARREAFAGFRGSKDRTDSANTDVLILSLGVGKFGHTLNRTKTVVYLDKTWNADDYIQSLHRVKRIGLTHSPRVITISARGTVDDLVEENLAGKMAPISQVTNADLVKLLRSLRSEEL